jgi:hypothetical protein
LSREWYVPVSKFVRIRVTSATAVNCYATLVWQE